MTLKELIISGDYYEIVADSLVPSAALGMIPYYITPAGHGFGLAGYEQWDILVAPKQMTHVLELIEKYKKLVNSPLYKLLEGED